MTLGEKIKKLRLQKELSQAELAKATGISLRSLQNYEANAFPPRYQRVYVSLAQALDCDVNYLKSDTSDFIITAAAKYGPRGVQQAHAILDQTAAMFAGGDLSEDDKLAFVNEIQSLYLDSKERAKKFTPKKYLHNDEK